ncbi:bifunctional diaminohydroxyphosphoribosylaminopyrimidine deaminase/5-amino-6-(5-phosphoribosylamino)uracil reductase RibD [Microbacterium sp. 13-71-7]|uniref:bifunctional diaminohydroxyphosphoribosylaminopyrimidine deaminase/5-amino-6-(5-phosphoribosylamino)uracil reductase RibD n=1 Tax=Microbacterium sp. 13-71-7 TaxID=1970399 RepID=UPI000BD70B5E|nr:bifunctional diaminohydroxyphosphoribosylaminopyrimidine deaminase/5-amino-6-(5-phosphoribosylamino)uracil reductase RibD [Microbacterium sp. 13-71-7]OZB82159.1 MAG: riboflavin biosynthesis protein RibD [Microbacterium sp. 13-71-7]
MTATAAERAAMTHALEIARRGPRGLNPQVGAVILSPAGDLLAEGWHRGAGTSHAEVDALSKLSPEQLRGATAVVTLEPCNHTGRTGPCAQALIDAGVRRVIYALDDPGAVSGGGAERMRAAGVDVVAGEQAEAAHALIDDWLTVQRLGRPHVTVKWAQSLDGRAAAADGSSQWITGPAARADVHRRRAAADAIVVGTGTVLADDPSLTARDGDALLPHQPVPVVIGARETPADAAVRRHPYAPLFYAEHDLAAVLTDLRDRGIQRVFVEGGPTLASAFLAAGLVDEVLAYLAPVLIGGPRLALTDIGVPSIGEARRLVVDEWQPLGADLLVVARPAEPDGATSTGAAPAPADLNTSRNEGAA